MLQVLLSCLKRLILVSAGKLVLLSHKAALMLLRRLLCSFFEGLVVYSWQAYSFVTTGYFDAPATKMAALGEASEEDFKAELPLVTLVFCAVNGLKAMRVCHRLALQLTLHKFVLASQLMQQHLQAAL